MFSQKEDGEYLGVMAETGGSESGERGDNKITASRRESATIRMLNKGFTEGTII